MVPFWLERALTCSSMADPKYIPEFLRPRMAISNRQNKEAYSNMSLGRTGHWNSSIHRCCCSACFGVRTRVLLYHLFGSTLTFHPGGHLGKLELVKDIIVALAQHLESGAKIEEWVGLNPDHFLSHEKVSWNPQRGGGKHRRAHYDSLFAERDFDSRYVLSVGDLFRVEN